MVGADSELVPNEMGASRDPFIAGKELAELNWVLDSYGVE